mmetsp:Transcript_8990/g.21921  ORF Transcript_8990/g.21921 Transcript_8990/m.21921 type:complete len:260 (-) Transcript_8990:1443-2222(-)
MWLHTTKSASATSRPVSGTSFSTHSTSKRDRIGSVRSTFCVKLSWESYRPYRGFAAAITEHRACSDAQMPAFAMEMVCCSIASWIATRSSFRILSNSSMHTTPPSASTMAPPSREKPPLELSLIMAAVRPAALEPLPDVYTQTGATRCTNFRNCDFAVLGSPSSKTFMSPRSLVWSGSFFGAPPKSRQPTAFFTVSILSFALAQIDGATDLATASTTEMRRPSNSTPSRAHSWNFSSSAGVSFGPTLSSPPLTKPTACR